jgi:hypothetical protein
MRITTATDIISATLAERLDRDVVDAITKAPRFPEAAEILKRASEADLVAVVTAIAATVDDALADALVSRPADAGAWFAEIADNALCLYCATPYNLQKRTDDHYRKGYSIVCGPCRSDR